MKLYKELWMEVHDVVYEVVIKTIPRGRSQDGGGLGLGDHFLSYKFMERTIER